MKNRLSAYLLGLLLTAALYGCKDKVNVHFEYEPHEPKIGETVRFTNLSDGGEHFDWLFREERTGTVTRSTAKNPTRTFTKPGDYVVSLRVDSNDNFTAERRLYVYDSIPSMKRDCEEVGYYGNVKFSAIAYNPYSRDTKYRWYFSPHARRVGGGTALRDTTVTIEDGSQAALCVSYDAEPVVFFNRIGTETVRLEMSVGDSLYTVGRINPMTFEVKDRATRSLLMAKAGGRILRQRIFENGVDVIETTRVNAGARPYNIVSQGEELYVFDAGTEGQADGAIRAVDLNFDREETVMTPAAGVQSDCAFYNGYVDDTHIYWTDLNDHVYRTPKSGRNLTLDEPADARYLVTDAARLADYGMTPGNPSGGIYAYGGWYYWAKGGNGRGLYRFRTAADGTVSDVSMILADYAVRAFVYDRNNRQIYFSATAPADKAGLWVADWDGKHLRCIEQLSSTDAGDYITGITLDYRAGKVLWATSTGVKQVKLLRSNPEQPETPTYFNEEKGIMGIALDNVEKIGVQQ